MGRNRTERPLGLIAQLAEAAMALESDGRVAFANGPASALLGRSADDLIGRRIDAVLPPRRPIEVDEGSSGAGGRIVTLRDISERVEVQTSLRRTSERLALDAPDARVGSWEWNFVAGTVRWSDQLYRIYGFEPGAFVPTYDRFLDLLHPDDRDGIAARHRQALADHQPFADVKRMRRADGAEILVRTDGEIVMAADGTPERMIGVSEDVTDYERARVLLHSEG